MKKPIVLLTLLFQLALPRGGLAETTTLAIGPNTLPPLVAGQAFSVALTASGGTPAYTWSQLTLPAGLKLDTQAGVLSGTPTGAGNSVVFVKAMDSLGTIVQRGWNVSIAPGAANANPPAGGSSQPAKYAVTIVNGLLNGGGSTASFAPGATVTITAGSPPAGQWFTQWSGNAPVSSSYSNQTSY